MDGVGEYCIELIDLFLFDGFKVETSKVSGLIRLLDLFLFKAFLLVCYCGFGCIYGRGGY